MVEGVTTEFDSMKYYISLTDIKKKDVKIEVFAFETISSYNETVNLTEIKKMFTNKEESGVKRLKTGSLDLLKGFCYAAFHPTKIVAFFKSLPPSDFKNGEAIHERWPEA